MFIVKQDFLIKKKVNGFCRIIIRKISCTTIAFSIVHYSEKPIFIVLTTDDISSQRRNGFVKTRNEVAKALAQKYHLPVIDLHTVATSNSECHVPDGVHFNAMGYELLAKCILESIC